MVENDDFISRRQFISRVLASSLAAGLSSQHADVFAAATISNHENTSSMSPLDHHIRDAVLKAQDFERDYADDVYLAKSQTQVMHSALQRLDRLQRLVGHANFNLISFDSAMLYARRYPVVAAFTHAEKNLIEGLFVFDARHYGFFGKKIADKLTDNIRLSDVKKIQGTGHYLYQGQALQLYERLRKQLGDQLILTSGIRSVVKQLHLFLTKVEECNGNLSRAARSLAPPGHSFHGIGDFDVGQEGLGAANFTSAFEHTTIHKQLLDLGLIVERYPKSNRFGVRHEPWHIKVVSHD